MTELDYDALQRLADAATPGPWENYSPNPISTPEQAIYSKWLETVPEARSSEIAALLTPKDAEFIAASRSAVPALLDRVRELEAELANAKDAWDSALRIVNSGSEIISQVGAERDAALSTIAQVRAVLQPHCDFIMKRAAKLGYNEGDCVCEQCKAWAALGSVPSTGEGNE